MGITSILLAISAFLLKEWESLYKIFAKLFNFATRNKSHGTYRGLEFEVNLELLDSAGQFADYYKRHKVKFLQDNVRLYQDIMWGKGNWYSDYVCSPGDKTNISHEGDRWNIEILLKDPKNRGDVEEFHIQTVARGVFTEPEEQLQVEIRNPTNVLSFQVIFPADRHSKMVVVKRRSNNQTTELTQEHISNLPDGRQIVRYELKKIKRLDVITLRWDW